MLTTFSLKILAVVFMTLDHLGLLFFPQALWLRVLGRLAFPIFAFLIAESCRKTRNSDAFLRRLFFWGFLSEIPFDRFYFGVPLSPDAQNIFFTLFLGALSIRLWQLRGNRRLLSLLPLAAGQLLAVDYGMIGVLTILLLYLSLERKEPVSAAGIIAINCGLLSFLYAWPVQLFGILALVPLRFYNGRRGRNWKYFFYLFYPLHLLVFWLIFQLIR